MKNRKIINFNRHTNNNMPTTRNKQYPVLLMYLLLFVTVMNKPEDTFANITCKGKFVNPISDICWECIMPISIGRVVHIGKGNSPKKRDTKNPSSPICMCIKNNIPIPGISIGFWEPVRLIDVTRTAYCMVNLGGMSIGSDTPKTGAYKRTYDKDQSKYSFYHLHYYVYPLIYWLELLTDFLCLEKATFDVAYMSEFDPSWNDEKLQSLLNPESLLFGNPIAQAACGIDCAYATTKLPLDKLFWCSGCWGNMYPFSGANADHIGGVQNSSLLTTRILAKMHRTGLAKDTSTGSDKFNGDICRKRISLKLKKSQYKLQMVNPKSTAKEIGCWPIGLTDIAYSSDKEYPFDGQDFGYLIWRKRNCCLSAM